MVGKSVDSWMDSCGDSKVPKRASEREFQKNSLDFNHIDFVYLRV